MPSPLPTSLTSSVFNLSSERKANVQNTPRICGATWCGSKSKHTHRCSASFLCIRSTAGSPPGNRKGLVIKARYARTRENDSDGREGGLQLCLAVGSANFCIRAWGPSPLTSMNPSKRLSWQSRPGHSTSSRHLCLGRKEHKPASLRRHSTTNHSLNEIHLRLRRISRGKEPLAKMAQSLSQMQSHSPMPVPSSEYPRMVPLILRGSS